ncbi:MAG: T9SS type A sorting domain-containing protein [Bacteroidia bacterium]
MKKFFLFLASFYLCLATAFAQAPDIQWQNTIGGDTTDNLFSVQQTSDGGYILGGSSISNISGDKTENCLGNWDYWVIKIDSIGNIQWQNTIGGNGDDELFSVQPTNDGGYILGGGSGSNISGDKTENIIGMWDYWIVKLDASGNIQWQNTIGGTHYEQFSTIQQTFDGGYIIGGLSDSNISGDKTENNIGGFGNYDYWILKLDGLGNIQWQNTIGGIYTEWLTCLRQTTNGGYIIGGYSNSPASGDKTENSIGSDDYWIIKLDSLGNIQWQNTIGGNNSDKLNSIGQTTDGGYILGGSSQSNISGDKTENVVGNTIWGDYWVIKIDSSGNIQWQNTIGGNDNDYLWFVQQTSEGGYVLGGNSGSNISGDKTEDNIGNYDFWIVKIDQSGNILWQNTIGGTNHDIISSGTQTLDAGFILSGWSRSNISGDKTENCLGAYDYWVIKLGPDTITGVTNLKSPTSNFQIYPNPADNELTITGLQSPIQKIEILNLLGETVFSKEPQTLNFKLQTTFLPSGIYIIKVYADEGVFQQKLVINR